MNARLCAATGDKNQSKELTNRRGINQIPSPLQGPQGMKVEQTGAGEDVPPTREDVGWTEMRWSWREGETKLLADVLTST